MKDNNNMITNEIEKLAIRVVTLKAICEQAYSVFEQAESKAMQSGREAWQAREARLKPEMAQKIISAEKAEIEAWEVATQARKEFHRAESEVELATDVLWRAVTRNIIAKSYTEKQ